MNDTENPYDRPSKSQRKRDVHALQDLGTALVELNAAQLAEYQKAQGQLGTALSRLLVVAENYPDLKASANFRDLQAQLEGTENRITVERGRFNAAVQEYNTKIKSLPTVFFAGFLGFQAKPYFQATAGAETAPAVKFDFGGTGAPAAK